MANNLKLNKDNYGLYGNTLSTIGGIGSAMSNKANGKVSVGGKTLSSGLSGAGAGMAFGPIGAAVGFVAGAALGGINANKTNKLISAEEEELKRKTIEDRNMMYSDYSKQVYNTFPTQGVQGAMMYGKYGGKILAGGGLVPATDTANVVTGDAHGVDSDGDGRNGVPIMDANGNQKAEVEKGEIIYTDAVGNQKVLSSRLGTADAAKKLMSTPEYQSAEIMFKKKVENINKQLSNTKDDKFMINTLNERLKGIKHPLDDLYNQQEQIKSSQGIPETQMTSTPMMAFGGEVPGDPLRKRSYGFKDAAFDLATDNLYPIDDTRQTDLQPAKLNQYQYKNNISTVSPISMSYKDTNTKLKPANLSTNINTTIPKLVERKDVKLSDVRVPEDNTNSKNNSLDTLNKFNTAISFADNIYNAVANSRRPNVPAPILNRALPLNTKINIDPILESNKKQLNFLTKNIDNTTGNSEISRSNKLAAFSSNIAQTNNVMMDKINKETELSNKALLNNQTVLNSNSALNNNYNMNKMMAADDKIVSNSENVANAVSKATMLVRQENLKQLDKQKLAIILQKYKNTGVLTRTENDYIDELIKMSSK